MFFLPFFVFLFFPVPNLYFIWCCTWWICYNWASFFDLFFGYFLIEICLVFFLFMDFSSPVLPGITKRYFSLSNRECRFGCICSHICCLSLKDPWTYYRFFLLPKIFTELASLIFSRFIFFIFIFIFLPVLYLFIYLLFIYLFLGSYDVKKW